MNNNEESFNWGSLILGILYVLIAIFALRNPTASLLTVVFMFGFGAILKGIYEIIIHRRLQNMTNNMSNGLIVLGVIDIILGLLISFNVLGGIIALPYIFAVWFIVDAIGSLATAGHLKELSTSRYWMTIILGVLGIIIGIGLFMNPVTAYVVISMLVGLFFLINGIGHIIQAF